MLAPASGFTPITPPCRNQPLGQPTPWSARKRRFHAGGGVNGVGAGSRVGSWRTTVW